MNGAVTVDLSDMVDAFYAARILMIRGRAFGADVRRLCEELEHLSLRLEGELRRRGIVEYTSARGATACLRNDGGRGCAAYYLPEEVRA